ncbi:unnamed protein product, partial [Mesorhabditis belari]|uniref:Stoned B-like protein n=1 Tax=Mesorhabditis belari TaxID=2138241 RepID=A0AAF3EVY0_9BILA
MSWRDDRSLPYDPHAGRNAFKSDEDGEDHPLARTARAMRSFTESIDVDLPPAPELPPSLDIDRLSAGMKNSDTNDTIVEVKREETIDNTLGETQKFKMVVPGPGHTEQEAEMHKSLLRDADEESLDSELEAIGQTEAKAESSAASRDGRSDSGSVSRSARGPQEADHVALRQQYSVTALTRPRPTTPTQQCAIESSAFMSQEEVERERERQEKIKVKIPAGGKRRKSDMSYSELYDSVQRSGSQVGGRRTSMNDYEGDILEENPVYRSVAPPKPVVHRRTSIEWENFEERKAAEREARRQTEYLEDKAFSQATTSREQQKTLEATGFDDSFAVEGLPQKRKMDDSEPEPEFSEDMAEERERFRKQSEMKIIVHADRMGIENPSDIDAAIRARVEGKVDEVIAQQIDQDQAYDYSQYEGWNPETQQFEGTYTDKNGEEQSYAEYYAHYFSQQQYYDDNGQWTGYETGQAPTGDGTTNEYYGQYYDQQGEDQQGQEQGNDYGQEYNAQASEAENQGTYNYNQGGQEQGNDYGQEYNAQASEAENQGTYDYNQGGQEYDPEYYNSEEYRKWYEENYGEQAASGEQKYEQTEYDQANYQQSAYDQGYDYSQTSTEGTAYYNNETNGCYQQGTSYDQQGYSYDQQEHYQPEKQEYAQDYSYQPTNPFESQAEAEQSIPPPRPPVVSKPLFEAPPPKDEFGWDSSATSSTQTSQAPPRPPPSPSRPPPPAQGTESQQDPTPATAPSRPPPAARPPPPRPVPPPPKKEEKKEEPEEDAWAQFKKMTDKVNVAVKSTEERLKDLSENTAVNDIKDESYLANVGGAQGYTETLAQQEIRRMTEEKQKEKALKKKMKQQGKRAPSPEYTLDDQERMDKASEELARQMAAKMAIGRGDPALADWKPPEGAVITQKPAIDVTRKDSTPADAIPPRKKSSIKEAHQESSSLDLPSHAPLTFQQSADSAHPIGDFHPDDPALSAPSWADFEATAPELAPSESGFFSKDSQGGSFAIKAADPFALPPKENPFAPPEEASLFDDNYDPFDVRPVEDIVAAAKAKAEAAKLTADGHDDMDYFGNTEARSTHSTPTPEGGSPISARPTGFDDEFKAERGSNGSTPTPLYDEDDSQPLDDFIPKFSGDGWELMIRHPLKKKIMADRFWKPCFVRLHGNTLIIYNSKTDNKPIQELLLQASYSLSDTTLQAYDVYGKIHTVKLQFVQYKERVGIRPGQISRLVDGHITKYGLPLEHSANCNVLLKFGSLAADELQSFVNTIEDILFKCPAKRDTKPVYKQDEVQIHCYDEYSSHIDKLGIVSDQKARVRMFCLAFVTGSPFLEIGLNDRRRQGKEVVRRKDILPMYTERWIRFENLEFHNTVDQPSFEQEQVIRLQPPDGCFFEIMRFRVRPPRNREKALTVKCIMKIAGSKVEIRMEAMAAAQVERSKGGKATRRQIPCEDIVVRFPIPEAWIYIFREERHWGVGSVHSKKLRPGKVKNLKDRLLGAVQQTESNLIEVAIGEAKYEHVYRSLVWRIPRLPEKHHEAYKAHLLKCRFELSSFDLMPETFLPNVEVDFTMPLATVSNTVVRSVSVEQHEDSDRVEKFVRYVAKCKYRVEIDYVQCADLDVDPTLQVAAGLEDSVQVPEMHRPAIHPNDVAGMHEGYRIDLPEHQFNAKRDDSSSDEEETKQKFPTIQIDMSNYGY